MPLSVVPTSVNEPKEPTEAENYRPATSESGSTSSMPPDVDSGSIGNGTGPEGEARPAGRRSRWVDYDTYELLEMISELEDERRWARLREGIWIAILVHLVLISGITWIPKYIFKVPPVVDPFEAIRQRKDDLKYLDLPPDLIKRAQPRAQVKPAAEEAAADRQEDARSAQQGDAAAVAAHPRTQGGSSLRRPPPPKPETQSQLEAPAPKPAPDGPPLPWARRIRPTSCVTPCAAPAARAPAPSNAPEQPGMAMHPGAGGGVQVLSDTQGVDFNPWLRRWYFETEHTWDPLIPDEVNPPILKQGQCMIRFKVLPNGRIMEGSMVLEGRSGDTALDRAAWGALTGSNYPPLPREFHGPYLELRAIFMYNMRPQ